MQSAVVKDLIREVIVAPLDRGFLAFSHDCPYSYTGWHYHPEYELHLIKRSSGSFFVGTYAGRFEPDNLVLMGPNGLVGLLTQAVGLGLLSFTFTGLVIGSDGKVKQLLDRKDKRPERPDFKEDGKGRTLIPGLIYVATLIFALLMRKYEKRIPQMQKEIEERKHKQNA